MTDILKNIQNVPHMLYESITDPFVAIYEELKEMFNTYIYMIFILFVVIIIIIVIVMLYSYFITKKATPNNLSV
jgi:hypothetical protein